jgi:endonuclease YncB( thermonuclease family)
MNRTTSFLAATVLIGACAALAIAEPSLEGNARVIDGDTLEINGQRVRLWGIDAFEAEQRCEETISSGTRSYGCGTAAWGAMILLTEGKIVRCLQRDIDRYKRIVAQCFVDNMDLGKELVLKGWAFDYTRYSGGHYKDVENAAHEVQRGAWAGSFQWPWDYRHTRAK